MDGTLQFGPFHGYVPSVQRHLVGPDAITENSLNVLVNPFTRELEVRRGSAIVGDTWNGTTEVTGLLESKWSARSRKAFAIKSPSFSDGLQTHGVLYTKDLNDASFPNVDTGYFGTVYLRNELAASLKNYQMLREFSTTTYPASGGTFNTEPVIKCVPLWYESGEGGYTRGATEMTRRFLASGSRSLVQTDDEVFLPNLRGTPCRWDKRVNGTTTGTERVRVFPTGPFAPLWCPTFAAADVTAATGVNDSFVKDGTTFYVSVMYEDRYGAFTMPAMPRPVNARLASGFGLVTVGTAGGGSFYRNFTLKNIPVGPPGTRRRIVLACDPQILGATAVASTLRIVGTADNPGLQVLGVLENNTQTSLEVSSLDLLADDNAVRFDHVCPRRFRYLFTGDQRVIGQVSLPSPCAIMLAPASAASDTTYDLNAEDDSSTLYGTKSFYYRLTSAELELCMWDTAGPTLTTQTFSFGTYTTLQDLVDGINATSVAGTPNCRLWRAQLAPGVDGTMDPTRLCPTTRDVTGVTCTINLPTIGGGDFSAVPIGALVTDPNFPAGTYVLSKQGTNAITLSANATATAGAHSATFYSWCGDGATSGTGFHASKRGYIRAHSGSYPGMLYFKRTALFGYDRQDVQSVYFTRSAPGDAVAGVSLAPNSWVRGNRRLPPPGSNGSIGRGMGGIDITGGALVGYSDGVMFFVNERGANTGEDFDIRLKTINLRRGVIADNSWGAGDGWGSYLTRSGIVAADKTLLEKVISEDLYNPVNGDGVLGDEINLCLASLDADADDAHFHAAVLGSELHVSFRDGAVSIPNGKLIYNFSAGVDASGLEELINPETRRTFGWSAQIGLQASSMCEVRRSGGTKRYMAVDTNAGATGDGRVDQFDTGTTDNGSDYNVLAYLSTQMAQTGLMFSAERAEVIHKSPVGSSVQITHYRTVDRAESNTRTLTESSSLFSKEMIELPENSRSNGEVCEIVWEALGTAAGSRLSKITVEFSNAKLYTQ